MLIAITGKRHLTTEQLAHTSAFLRALTRRLPDMRMVAYPRYYEFLAQNGLDNLPVTPARGRFDADLALSIGGDGTLLRTARWIGSRGTPILGINSGHLGYLADMTMTADYAPLVDAIAERRYTVQQRTLLMVEGAGTPLSRDIYPYALNEVAVLRDDGASMIAVSATLDGAPLATYQADGLIVATPTGSTGYNLSVGGPILAPTSATWAVSPIAAHALTMRPLVISDDSVIELHVDARVRSYRLSIDGRSVSLPLSQGVRLTKAPYTVAICQRPGHNFADTLRTKLLWGVDGR